MTNVKRSITISKNLRWLRQRKGFTQKEMTEMLDIPVSTYAMYELGDGIGRERLQLLCDFWCVDVEHIEMEPEVFQPWYRLHMSMYGEAASWCKGV